MDQGSRNKPAVGAMVMCGPDEVVGFYTGRIFSTLLTRSLDTNPRSRGEDVMMPAIRTMISMLMLLGT